MKPTQNKSRNCKRDGNHIKLYTVVILILIICVAFWLGLGLTRPETERINHTQPGITVYLPHLYSSYAILVDVSSGKTIGHKGGQVKMYPASLTKIMTAMLVIEETKDLNRMVTLDPGIFDELYNRDASMAGFQPGERATVRELLYGVLLPSGAECCLTLAEEIVGSEQLFVERMNQKAKALGMLSTNFCNATGLHETEHYSTVEDISILLRYALKNETFRTVFTSAWFSTQPSEQHPDGFTFRNTVFSGLERARRDSGQAEIANAEILGGKTGYTKQAGLCLASLAQVNGQEYILVTAKASAANQSEVYHILDAIEVCRQLALATS